MKADPGKCGCEGRFRVADLPDLCLEGQEFREKYGRNKAMAAMTLGCKANQYDTDVIKDSFVNEGYDIADFDSGNADVFVINTCAVTALSDRKSRQMIRRARAKNPGAVIIAAGCYPQSSPGEVSKMTEIDILTGTRGRRDIVRLVCRFASEGRKKGPLNNIAAAASPALSSSGMRQGTVLCPGKVSVRQGTVLCPGKASASASSPPSSSASASSPPSLSASSASLAASSPELSSSALKEVHTGHTRAFMKIQDGCDRFCSYCIIPYLRGPLWSKPPAEAAEEARNIATAGYSEIVLTGINIASYGRGQGGGGVPLTELIHMIHETEGIERIRLGSLEPSMIDHSFIDFVACHRKICRHFHLSLQSGSDSVLRRMNRNYDTKGYREAAGLIVQSFEDAGITTDIIAGFPGETDEEFAQTTVFGKSAFE